MSDPEWVTYAEAAERLGISVEGVRLKVKRDQKLGKDARLRVRRDNNGRMLLAWDEALLDQRGVPRVVQHVGGDVGSVGAMDAKAIESLTKLLNRVQFETRRFQFRSSPSGRPWKVGTTGFKLDAV